MTSVLVMKRQRLVFTRHALYGAVQLLLIHVQVCIGFNTHILSTNRQQQVLVNQKQHVISTKTNNFQKTSWNIRPTLTHNTEVLLMTTTTTFNDQTASDSKTNEEEIFDVIIIGAGIGGLSCAAVLTKCYGYKTLCIEVHDTPGGVAHSFDRFSSAGKFTFDSGPSLLSGMSYTNSTNPLRQVLDATDTAKHIQWKTYNGWLIHDLYDKTSFKVTTGPGTEFEEIFETKQNGGSINAKEQFILFRNKILQPSGLADVSAYIPPFAIRNGNNAMNNIRPLTSYLLNLIFGIGPMNGNLLTGPFSNILDKYKVSNKLVRYWYDYLAFALSGLDASQTQAAAIAYMMKDLHKENAVLDYPMGGMGSLIDALVSGFHNVNNSELRLNTRVEQLVLSSNDKGTAAQCTGVVLADGTVIHARRGVVSNAPLWNMAKIVKDSISHLKEQDDKEQTEEESTLPSADEITNSNSNSVVFDAVTKIQQQANDMCYTRSFMHLHLGIIKDGIPDDIECHHSVLDMSKKVTDEQNMVIISIPTVFDTSLAPEGYHVIHAYSAACDNFDDWESFMPNTTGETGKVGESPNTSKAASYGRSEQYQQLKNARAEILWNAIEQVIPDIRERAQRKDSVVLIGTPLTHRRYNQRYKGTYGPAPLSDNTVWELPDSLTPIDNLYACGDTTFPGIGLPGVAASGTIAANTIASVEDQTSLVKKLKKQGVLQ